MKERPILFSGPMVRAILEGRKTQTRRIVRIDDTPITTRAADVGKLQRGIPSAAVNVRFWGPYLKCDAPAGSATVSARVDCPYGAPEDRLWVRETWRSWRERCTETDEEHVCGPHCDQTYVGYAATPRKGYRPIPDRASITYLDDSTPLESDPRLLGPWKPSIHMPRAFSRLSLEVAAVRCERLQDITREDVAAEGVTLDVVAEMLDGRDPKPVLSADPLDWWRLGWDAINGERAPWASNPYVWVVSFKRAGGQP